MDEPISRIQIEIGASSEKATSEINKTASALQRLKTSASSGSASTGLRNIGRAAQDATKHTSQLLSSLKRIAFYRAIRSAIKAIASAVKEGMENFYNFSQVTGEAMQGYAAAVDSMRSSSQTMKNQVGAAFGTLYQIVMPIISAIISAVTKLANVLTMIFARLGGASGWYRATQGANDLADAIGGAGGAAKEALKYLAPFDEINRLPDENKGGGGGGGAGGLAGDLYEWVPFDKFDILDGISDLVETLKNAFNGIAKWFEDIDWHEAATNIYNGLSRAITEIDWAGLAQSMSRALGAALGAATGFLDGIVQSVVSDIKTYFSKYITDENNDGHFSGAEIIHGLYNGISAELKNIDAWINENVFDPFVRGFKKAFGTDSDIGVDLSVNLDSLELSDKSGWNKDTWKSRVYTALAPVAGAAIGLFIGGPGGAAFGAKIGLGLSLLISFIKPGDGTGWGQEDWLNAIETALGPVAGAAIGFKYGGAKGALFGATIGMAVSLLIKDINPKDDSGWTRDNWISAIYTALLPTMGAAFAFHITGGKNPMGALFGATIGLGLAIALRSIDRKIKNENTALTKDDWASAIISAILPTAGLIAGLTLFPAAGVAGALIGATIGISLALVITGWSWGIGSEDALPSMEDIVWDGPTVEEDNTDKWRSLLGGLSNVAKEEIETGIEEAIKETNGGAVESVDVQVELEKDGWDTVSDWTKSFSKPGDVIWQEIGLEPKDWGASDVQSWVKHRAGRNYFHPVELQKDGWTTVADWTRETAQYGEVVSKDIILESKMDSARETNKKVASFISTWNGLNDRVLTLTIDIAGMGLLNTLLSMLSAVASFFGTRFVSSVSSSTKKYATGGFPEDGLFMANHGELVGKFSNGRTAVANNEQIVQGIERGVYNAVSAAMSNRSTDGGREIRVYLDGKQITNAVTRNQNNMSRATGVA